MLGRENDEEGEEALEPDGSARRGSRSGPCIVWYIIYYGMCSSIYQSGELEKLDQFTSLVPNLSGEMVEDLSTTTNGSGWLTSGKRDLLRS